MAAHGYTTVHELAANPDFIDVAREAASTGELAVRIIFYVLYNDNCNVDQNYWETHPYTDEKDTLLRVAGIKGFCRWRILRQAFPVHPLAGHARSWRYIQDPARNG